MDENDFNDNSRREPAATEVKRKGLALLIYDLKHRELIPVKVLTFILFAGIGSLFSFITIHMKSLGLTVEETGIINSVSSVAAVFAPFFLGLIADKVGNFRVMMCVLNTIVVAVSLLFVVIPVGRIPHKFPDSMTLAVGCGNETSDYRLPIPDVMDLDSTTCHLKSPKGNQSTTNVPAVLEECGYVCYNQNRSQDPFHVEANPLPTQEMLNVEELPAASFRDSIFFSQNWTLGLACFLGEEEDCYIYSDFKAGLGNLTLGLVPSAKSTSMFSLSRIAADSEGEQKMKIVYCGSSSNGRNHKFRQNHHYQDINQTDHSNNTVYQICKPECIVRVNRSDLCSNMAEYENIDPKLTFGLYMVVRLLFDTSCGVLDLFVAASVALVNQVGGDYGFQRMFGFIGVAIFSPISGALIDYFSSDTNTQGNIRPAFYLFAGLFTIAAIVMLKINLDFKLPAKSPFKDVTSLLKNVELDLLLFAGFISGIAHGYGIFWTFPFLEEIGGNKSLMGLSNTLQSLASIPLLIFSDRIFRKLSHPNVITICFGAGMIRFIGYSFLSDPNLCLLFEPMEAISSTLIRTALITYANELGTTTNVASIQGLLSGITFGLGWGVSSYGGSLLIDGYGQRVTFRVLGVMSFIAGFIYLLFNFLYLRPKKNQQITESNARLGLNGKIETSQ
ncbi:uncharacterized protein LOC124199271 isoform X1 [Daphnia pulex]|uniref:uncharacterized protein LOC124199271 isoform X1 n=1 Tax=Daphnia pulex TaxID=6669 RepID=UPI001EE0D5F4|nr:uncharacterized protein LOC124199271 isoform X1 [Daphnia pulex]XP_046450999.1 uncharacterized protein LOC124199271 isoform X1 [Daphnia pulex]XP_046451000.1 uncharacterized protein LOC124199271 isoform X1 [Daphnia pulex]